ncbi:MAG TPA: amidohydrolase family protein [Nitrososphaerales archaeon]|nr:amidohydrolase family protein [Nitrososphaerales archaeon]
MHNNLSTVFPFKDTDLSESPAITVLRCYRRADDALKAGITSLRTVGEQNRADLYLKKMINTGWIRGPRIFAAGKGLGSTGGHGSDFGQVEVDGPEQFERAAREELSLGVDHLKIFITGGIAKEEEALEEPQMTREEMAAMVSVARDHGTYVAAHAGGSRAIVVGAEAGVKSFEHAYVLTKEAARAVRGVDGVIVPTLSVTRSPEWMKENHFEDWTIEKALSSGTTHLESIRTAVREGVRLLVGTDLPAGDESRGVNCTVREIEYLQDAGSSPLEALRSATIHCAKLCKAANELGKLKPNFLADVIAVPSNPLSDLKALEQIHFVMKDGMVIRNNLGG